MVAMKSKVKTSVPGTVGGNGTQSAKPEKPAKPERQSNKLSIIEQQKLNRRKERKVVYPHIEIELCLEEPEYEGQEVVGAITAEQAKVLLGWETEAQFIARMKAKDGSLKDSQLKFGDHATLRDFLGNPVICWNSLDNRFLDQKWAKSLDQDMLNKNWADSRNTRDDDEEPMSINGETIIIGKYGNVLSANHRLVGLVLAQQLWAGPEKDHWQSEEHWGEEEPTIEGLIVYGISENPRVIQTLDNTKPRSPTDIFFTSPLFKDLNPVSKHDCSQCLSVAVKRLWARTHQMDYNVYEKFMTNSTLIDFVERHPKILDCVRWVYEHDKHGEFQLYLQVQPGICAALMYLMGASATDPDKYIQNPPPSEEHISWKHWKKAMSFWESLSDCMSLSHMYETSPGTDKAKAERLLGEHPFHPLLKKIQVLISKAAEGQDADEDLTGVSPRIGTLIKAWLLYANDEPFTDEDLSLQMAPSNPEDPNSPKRVDEWPVCCSEGYGIDFGDHKAPKEPKENPPESGEEGGEEDEGDTEEEPEPEPEPTSPQTLRDKMRAASGKGKSGLKDKGKAVPQPPTEPEPKTPLEEIAELQSEAGDDVILLFKVPGGYKVYGDHADTVSALGGKSTPVKAAKGDWPRYVVVTDTRYEEFTRRLLESGETVAVVDDKGGDREITPIELPKPAKARKGK